MSDRKIFNFKAPGELEEAIRKVVFNSWSKPNGKKYTSHSDFLRQVVMSNKEIAAELKKIQNGKVQVQKV